MTSSRNLMCKRLMSLGLKQHLVHRLVDDAQKWLARNGTEWTIRRLKDAKSYYLSTLAGKDPEMDTWWAKKGDKYRSPWLNIPFSDERGLVRAMIACNAYTLFVKKGDPTPNQLRKFYTSVEQELNSLQSPREVTKVMIELGEDPDSAIQALSKACGFDGNVKMRRKPEVVQRKLDTPKPFFEHIYSEEKKGPSIRKENRDKESEMKWVFDNITSPAVMGRLYKYRGLASAAGFTQVLHQVKLDPTASFDGGMISYIQEPGYKLRAVANPSRVHQVVLDELKHALMRKLRSLPSDCTHDQRAGAEWAQLKLQEGRTLHAVDLSDATNNIPLEPQIAAIVAGLNLDIHDKTTSDTLSYFIECSRAAWTTPEGKTIRWTRGQPLGLGPSFGAFALWHNLTLMLCHRAAKSNFPANDSFRIVGDDVVIACDATHALYRKCLSHMGIPVSEAKCISSNKCTEFVGFVVTPTALHPVPKWKHVSDRNFMDVLALNGPSMLSWLRPRQRAVAKLLMPIPEEFGGLGWNPKGEPLEARVLLACELGLLDDSPEIVPIQEQTQAARRLINKVAYGGNLELWTTHVGHVTSKLAGSTRAPLDSHRMLITADDVGVHSDVNEQLVYHDSYRVGPTLASGDPRGKTSLESWEQSLSLALLRDAEDEAESKGTKCDNESSLDEEKPTPTLRRPKP